MFSKRNYEFFALMVLLTAAVFGNFCTINANDADNLIHCKDKEAVISPDMGEIQKNCSIELHSTPDNTTCISLCLLQHYGGLDDDGKPSKEKFDKIVDEKAAPDLKEKMKNMTCYEHAHKIEKGENMCETLKDFEGCFDKFMIDARKYF